MGALTINGLTCSAVSVTVPLHGAWSADATLHGSDGPAAGEAAELVVGGRKMVGTVRRGASHGGTRRLRLVGGAGGWRKVIPPKGYSHIAGVRLSSVVQDAAREVGETAVVASDRVVGTAYVRDRGRAERVVRLLAGDAWYVDAEGKTQVRSREASAIRSAFTVTGRDAASGMLEIATEAYEDWIPGRTFSSPTVQDEQTISSVSIRSSVDSGLRLLVLATDDARERLLADVRAVVQSELASLSYLGLWEYKVASATDRTLDATATDARMPDLRNVPYWPGLHGERATPPSGARVLVAFANADPARPVVVGVRGGATEHLATVESVVLLLHNFMSLLGQANGIFIGPVIAAQVVPMLSAALAAAGIPAPPPVPPIPNPAAAKLPQQIAAAAASGAMAPGVPGNTVALYKAQIEAFLKTKQSDVSGLFPGVGVPEAEEIGI